jgi:mevalonate kinase
MKTTFHAHGKLLLSAEYFVLDGAKALALPLKLGQNLEVETYYSSPVLYWKSLDEYQNTWFEASFRIQDFKILETSENNIAERLKSILQACRKLNPDFLSGNEIGSMEGYKAVTRLNFDKNWGLGTSSTLVFLIAQWAKIDPYELQFRTFGGSGYDIACAASDCPIIYSIENNRPVISPSRFCPIFHRQLYFIYLGKKQNSREGIRKYKSISKSVTKAIELASQITALMSIAQQLHEFESYMLQHEDLVSKTIGLEKVKDRLFPDYWGQVKSLGAWGGDFVLATSRESEEVTRKYFCDKGYSVFFRFEELVLSFK